MNSFTLMAPAKINLLLGVSQTIVEGKHQLSSIFSTISLSDQLVFSYDPNRDRQITIDLVNAPEIAPLSVSTEQNIVYKAVIALEQALNKQLEGHLTITMEKRIPHEAGLGGGSSDAAATLIALRKIWGIESFKYDAPVQMAAQSLGADVPFFLQGGCALMGGYGDRLIQILPQPHLDLVLVKPEAGVSTAKAYAQFDADPLPAPPTDRLVSMLVAQESTIPLLTSQFANNLSKAACALLPELATLQHELATQEGVYKAMVSGSGSAVFGVCANEDVARQVAASFKESGYWAVAATTA